MYESIALPPFDTPACHLIDNRVVSSSSNRTKPLTALGAITSYIGSAGSSENTEEPKELVAATLADNVLPSAMLNGASNSVPSVIEQESSVSWHGLATKFSLSDVSSRT